MRLVLCAALMLMGSSRTLAQAPTGDVLPDTARLELAEPLDVAMVRGINAFADQEIGLSPKRRLAKWKTATSTAAEFSEMMQSKHARFRTLIGAVDDWPAEVSRKTLLSEMPNAGGVRRMLIRTRLFDDVDAEFYVLAPPSDQAPMVILVPDADWSPEQMTGEMDGLSEPAQLARRLIERSVGSIIVRLVNRSDEFSGRPSIRFTNQPHREYLYRPAFELGRHIIGYEVQKILKAVDLVNPKQHVVVWGVGEGGLLAMFAAAIDPRIQTCVVSGYFQEREGVWKEPISRNVWRQLAEFGDAEVAGLIAPRTLIIEACATREVDGPPPPSKGRAGAAPGMIATPLLESVQREYERARTYFLQAESLHQLQLVRSADDGWGPSGTQETMQSVLLALGGRVADLPVTFPKLSAEEQKQVPMRQQRLVEELRRHTQRLLHDSAKKRDELWSKADRSSLAAWERSQEEYRTLVYDELIGRIPYALLPANARTRKVIDEPTHVGYEVVLDVFRSEAGGSEPVIAGGILLVPRDLKVGEKRPVVVCQHGLEGTPMDTITTDPKSPGYRPYQGFSTQLVRRGFIVYAPQNPYRGKDEFRVIQRKSNPLGWTLFSYIVPQHQQTLNWLATLPYVDTDRIGFYGLSYGGKTAMRVPPLLPPRPAQEGRLAQVGYCLSICSADFNEWILKNASTEDRHSYVFTHEYEIFEWNMGHIANYAELASLMTPRPFMVERGHDDGVAPDEWVAWEFAKVKRHYDKLGIGDRAELEVFNGPHTINGKGTFDFLHRHLNWPRLDK